MLAGVTPQRLVAVRGCASGARSLRRNASGGAGRASFPRRTPAAGARCDGGRSRSSARPEVHGRRVCGGAARASTPSSALNDSSACLRSSSNRSCSSSGAPRGSSCRRTSPARGASRPSLTRRAPRTGADQCRGTRHSRGGRSPRRSLHEPDAPSSAAASGSCVCRGRQPRACASATGRARCGPGRADRARRAGCRRELSRPGRDGRTVQPRVGVNAPVPYEFAGNGCGANDRRSRAHFPTWARAAVP